MFCSAHRSRRSERSRGISNPPPLNPFTLTAPLPFTLSTVEGPVLRFSKGRPQLVIPAPEPESRNARDWIPAFAGMTTMGASPQGAHQGRPYT